jgi:hypothetical protein
MPAEVQGTGVGEGEVVGVSEVGMDPSSDSTQQEMSTPSTQSNPALNTEPKPELVGGGLGQVYRRLGSVKMPAEVQGTGVGEGEVVRGDVVDMGNDGDEGEVDMDLMGEEDS